MGTVGELSENRGEFAVEWRIKEFFSLPAEVDTLLNSPVFSFAGVSWRLSIYPNGKKACDANGKIKNTEGFVAVYLNRITPGHLPIHLEYSLGLKILDGKVERERDITYNFDKVCGYGFYEFLNRSGLIEKKSELVPSGVLRVVCKMKYPKTADISSNTAPKKCPYCKSIIDADEDLASHQLKCMEKPIKCPECSDVVALKDWYGHKCQKTGAKGRSQVVTSLNPNFLSPIKRRELFKIKYRNKIWSPTTLTVFPGHLSFHPQQGVDKVTGGIW